MGTGPLNDSSVRIPVGDGVWRVRSPELQPVEAATPPVGELDVVHALAALGTDPPELAENELADALLAWLAPRPRNPDTLAQPRIVPLLGLAADLLARGAQTSPDIVSLGSAALEQELRMHRILADRRATLIMGAAE